METLRIGLCVLVCVVGVSAVSHVYRIETNLSCYTCSDALITADEENTTNEVAYRYPPQNASCRNAIKDEMDIEKCYLPSFRPETLVAFCYTTRTVTIHTTRDTHKNYTLTMLERDCGWEYVASSKADGCYDSMPGTEPGEIYGVSGKRCSCSTETCNHVLGSSPNTTDQTSNTPDKTSNIPGSRQATLSPSPVHSGGRWHKVFHLGQLLALFFAID